MENGYAGGAYAMGPRIPLARKRDTMGTMTSTLGFKVPSRVLAARATATETVDCNAHPNLCEKPVGSSSLTLPVALGVW